MLKLHVPTTRHADSTILNSHYRFSRERAFGGSERVARYRIVSVELRANSMHYLYSKFQRANNNDMIHDKARVRVRQPKQKDGVSPVPHIIIIKRFEFTSCSLYITGK